MIAVDCEMSGLSPTENGILSIGAVEVDNPENTFYGECRLREGRRYDVEALAVNGFKVEDILSEEKVPEQVLMKNFYNWLSSIEEKTLLGQNVSLDKAFLDDAFLNAHINFKFHYRVVDLHSSVCAIFIKLGKKLKMENGQIKMSLENIAMSLGLPIEPSPHNALTGAKYNLEIWNRVVHDKNTFKEFESFGEKNEKGLFNFLKF